LISAFGAENFDVDIFVGQRQLNWHEVDSDVNVADANKNYAVEVLHFASVVGRTTLPLFKGSESNIARLQQHTAWQGRARSDQSV
jgi:hypothetical protein